MAHLSKSIVDSWFDQQELLSNLTHNVIYNRLEEIVLIIGKSFGVDLEDCWYLFEPNHYALCEASCKEFIEIKIDWTFKEYQKAILSDGQIFDPNSDEVVRIPSRWLYEDFKQELKDGIEKFAAKFDVESAERLEKSIKSKLTKEELELISFK